MDSSVLRLSEVEAELSPSGVSLAEYRNGDTLNYLQWSRVCYRVFILFTILHKSLSILANLDIDNMLNHACSNSNTITLTMFLPLPQLTFSSRRGGIVSSSLLDIRLGASGLAFCDDVG